MKQLLKRLLLLAVALIVVFAYNRIIGVDTDTDIQPVGSSTQTIPQETDEPLKETSSVAEISDDASAFGQDAAADKEEVTESSNNSDASDAESLTEDAGQFIATAEEPIDEDGVYTSKEDVALYIHTYGKLPSNFITKKEAEAAGWPGGNLEPYCPGKCIGGSHFGNYEGLLPDKKGRSWTECDIDTLGAKSRGAKRIIFSNDGLIYYTDDHYESFELLYGEP